MVNLSFQFDHAFLIDVEILSSNFDFHINVRIDFNDYDTLIYIFKSKQRSKYNWNYRKTLKKKGFSLISINLVKADLNWFYLIRFDVKEMNTISFTLLFRKTCLVTISISWSINPWYPKSNSDPFFNWPICSSSLWFRCLLLMLKCETSSK
jgi:hypothetical protein